MKNFVTTLLILTLFLFGAILAGTPSDNEKEIADNKKEIAEIEDEKEEVEEVEEIEEEAIEMTVAELNKAFENEAKGNKNYKGKNIIATGKVKSVRTCLGDYVLTIGDETEMGVSCTMKDNQEDIIAELEEGQEVRIKGICQEKCITVGMEDCEVIKAD